MGDIIGELSGSNAALSGFNYLKNNPFFNSYLSNGAGANSAIAALLGLGGDTAAANAAFNNYKNSTGYNFQLQQGQNAINSNSAAKGLLNSGATAKALTGFGQNLASTTFNNYLNQLSGLSSGGLNALGMISQAGSGANAAEAGQLQGGFYGGLMGTAMGFLGL